jgi:hypothetical protein
MSLSEHFLHLTPARRRELMQELGDFAEGKLSIDRWPQVFQDVLESGALSELPHRFAVAAQHCVDVKLCTYTGRIYQ